jgi:hypothetical protein
MIIAVKFEQYNFISVIVGIFMIQLFILADHIVSHLTANRKKQA